MGTVNADSCSDLILAGSISQPDMIKEPISNKFLLSLQKDATKKNKKKVVAYGSRTNKFRSLQVSNAGSLRVSKNNEVADIANENGVHDSKSEVREEAGGS